jgi:sugar phosphate isomerase/epimerase
MRISLITDEVSHDPATAFELARRWGIEHHEIRSAYRWRLPVSPAWAAERVVSAVRDYGVTVTAISPGLFKPTMEPDGTSQPVSADAPDEVRRHVEVLLPRFFAFAERLGTHNVIVFALPRSHPHAQGAPAIVTDSLAQAAERARAGGFRLLLENGPGSWADTAEAAGAILDAVGSPALGLTWDPANAASADPRTDPVLHGYQRVRPHVAGVHVKDVAFSEGKPAWVPLGEGTVNWPEQIRRLRADGYDGFLTVEPHFQYQPGLHVNLVQRVEQFVARLREMLDTTR